MAAAYVNGVQAHGVGTSLKHFAANNQETERFRYSADIDPRPLHETYLRAFEARGARSAAVVGDGRLQQDQRRLRDAGPVVAHRYAAGPVGFEGLVVSDWGAVDDRVASVAAGLDLEMPGGTGLGPRPSSPPSGTVPSMRVRSTRSPSASSPSPLTAADNAVDTDYDKRLSMISRSRLRGGVSSCSATSRSVTHPFCRWRRAASCRHRRVRPHPALPGRWQLKR